MKKVFVYTGFSVLAIGVGGLLGCADDSDGNSTDTDMISDTDTDSDTDGDSDTDTDTDSDSDSDSDTDTDTDSDTDTDTGGVVGTTINETGFEGLTNGTEYTQASWTAAGFAPSWVNGFNQSRAFADTSQANGGSGSLRVDYPAGTFGPDINGAQAPLTFTPRDEVYISYSLRFSDNFEWGGTSQGGKLPGLGSGDNCSGGSSCDGTNGFSARLMWREGGRAVLYLYHMDKPATWGEDIQLAVGGSNVIFAKGQWYQVTERVKINTGNNSDGEVQVWIDGAEALLKTGVRLVNNGDLVDNFYFSTFHGGNDATWAPSVDCSIFFDDVRIYTVP